MKTYQLDSEGNQLTFINNGNTIKIGLVVNCKERQLGFIDIKTQTFNVKRSRAMHLLKVANSYGFNYKLISEATKFNKVHIKDEYDEWLIPNSEIIKNGTFLHFVKQHGFELQCFITLDQLKPYSIKKQF